MPFSTRNPAELELNKPYRFTRDINGYSYIMILRSTRTDLIWFQDCQYGGIKPDHPTSLVYNFDTEFGNGSKGGTLVWEKTYNEITHTVELEKSDGVWTEIE